MHNHSKPFVIITMARSGSYYLASLLDSASDLRCYGELYKKNAVEMPRDELKAIGISQFDVTRRDGLGYHFLDRVLDLNPGKITGFKAFPDHITQSGMCDLNTTPHWRRVLLTRNVVEQYVSLVRARVTGIFIVNHGEEVDKTALEQPVTVDFQDFDKFLSYRADVDMQFAQMLREQDAESIMKIDYSDMADLNKLQELLDFLGSTALANDLHSPRRKQFPHSIDRGVENFEELYQYLNRTGRGHLLPKQSQSSALVETAA